jgi:hypothetical protein
VWNLWRIGTMATVIGLVASGGVICIYYLFVSINPRTPGYNYFGRPYDTMCFYTVCVARLCDADVHTACITRRAPFR